MAKKKTSKKTTGKASTVSTVKDMPAPKRPLSGLRKPIKTSRPAIKGASRLFRDSFRHLVTNWRLFGGIVAIYLLLTVLLVKGLGIASNNIPEMKSSLEELFKGTGGQFAAGFTLFGLLLGTSGSVSGDVAGAYQTILLVVVSLVLIWSLRQTMAGKQIGVKESFYKSLYPLIPFVLILLVIGVQLVPLLLGNFLLTTVIGNGLALSGLEQAVWILLFGLLALVSIYLISSSVFALYIVTLPDTMPMQALRTARELVRHRRWSIIRKILFLPLILLLIAAAIMIPIIMFVTPLTEWVFFLLGMGALAIIHSYMYSLYRELL